MTHALDRGNGGGATASSPRWVGYCHGCQRNDVEVESRREHYERTLCDACYQSKPLPLPTVSGRRVAACDSCGERHQTEFSLNLDARLCDRCYRKAVAR